MLYDDNKREDSTNTRTQVERVDDSADRDGAGYKTENSKLLDTPVTRPEHNRSPSQGGQTQDNPYKFIDGKGEHLHLLRGSPLTGTSSVMDVLGKPLHWWALQIGLGKLGYVPAKVRQHKIPKGVEAKHVGGGYYALPQEYRLKAASDGLSLIRLLSAEQYLALLDTAYKAHTTESKDAADRGKLRHALCEKYIKDVMAGRKAEEPEEIKSFIEWSKKHVKRFLWSEMHCYSEKHWVGGISDAGFVDMQDRVSILDFKSSAEAYMSQYWQIAGYDLEISENGGYTAEGQKVYDLNGGKIDYYTVFPFGAVKPEPQYYHNPQDAKEIFLALLKVYRSTPRV